MNWATLALPQVWIVAAISAALIIRGWRRRQWPPADDFVELVGYAAALWGARASFLAAIAQSQVDAALAHMAGTVLLSLSAFRGIWKTLRRPPKRVKPTAAAAP